MKGQTAGREHSLAGNQWQAAGRGHLLSCRQGTGSLQRPITGRWAGDMQQAEVTFWKVGRRQAAPQRPLTFVKAGGR